MGMQISQSIGIVGASGWLAGALVLPAVARGVVDPARLVLSSRSGGKGALAGIPARWTTDNAALARDCDVVILSVRPDQFGAVAVDLRGKLAISVMAGISCARIAGHTGAARIVRAMPNAAAAIARSFTPWFAQEGVTAEDKELAQAFFAASGEAAEVPKETHIDYCAGLTGAGAAFPALLAESMMAHAIGQGLPPAFAARAAKGVVCGASQLFASETARTGAIVQEMIDYRGTTAAALQAMLDAGFMKAVASGLEAAAAKSARLAVDN
jgi:pyrroline-5-carboxylate reductase